MPKATKGDKVKVNYTGTLEDGSIFDSSEDREPLEFTMGEGQLIPGFENAVEGMAEGESTTVDIPTDEAYGERRDDLSIEIGRSELPVDVDPEVGMKLQMKQKQKDEVIPVTITDVSEEQITIDANHPLAGEDLTFEINVVNVSKQ